MSELLKKPQGHSFKFNLFKSSLMLSTLGSTTLFVMPSRSVELPSGQVAFDHPPRLITTAASFQTRRMPTAVYQFTLNLPEDAGEPLKAVSISQRESTDSVEFQSSKSRAFLGDSFASGPELTLSPVGGSTQSSEVTVVFDPPVQPGSTVTVAVKPKKNPFTAGIYLFGVTAFPEGEASRGQFLGYGRIHIYD